MQNSEAEALLAEIRRLEAEIADLKRRWPAHSVKPAMVQQLEELEERLALLKEKVTEGPLRVQQGVRGNV